MERRSLARRVRRGLAFAAVALFVFGLIGFAAGEIWRGRDHLPGLRARKGRLLEARETPLGTDVWGTLVQVDLRGEHGLEVEAHLRLPAGRAGPHPVLVILGGLRTGRKTLDYLGDAGPFALLALDYPYQGKTRKLGLGEFLSALPAMHRAVLDTVPAGMLAVDYLLQRADVDACRIVLAGGSLGALFAPALAAADERIGALALFFGAGDLEALGAANVDLPAALRAPLLWLAATLVAPIEPLDSIGRVSPRPVFLLNGTEDERIPERLGRCLQEAARAPKTVRWMSVGHVDIRATEFHQAILDEFVAWMLETGFLPPGSRITARPDESR